jgi:hypothetical protein
MISVFWFGPPSEVKFGPLEGSWIGFLDGAKEAYLAIEEGEGGAV